MSVIKEIVEILRDMRQEMHKQSEEMHKQSELMEFMVKKEELNKLPAKNKKIEKKLQTII